MGVDVRRGTVLGSRFTLQDPVDHDVAGIERYAAHDSRLDRDLVVDLVRTPDPEAIRRAATRASRLRDPRLTRIVATGSEPIDGEDVTYVAIEPVTGVTLSDVLAGHRVDPRRAVTIVGGAARALAAARAEGLVHGHLRPRAITVTERGRVVVSGVGIDGEAMAQTRGDAPPTERDDAHALARLLIAALTGVDPEAATPADLPEGLAPGAHGLAAATLAGDPPDSVGEVVAALSPFDSRALIGFTGAVGSLAPTPAVERARALAAAEAAEAARVAAERAERERRERLAEAGAVVDPDTVALAAHEAEEAVAEEHATPQLRVVLREADDAVVEHARHGVDAAGEGGTRPGSAAPEPEAPAITQEIPPGAAVQPDGPADKYEAGFDTLEIMVAAQNVERDKGTWELVLEALHRRWPRARAITRSLERARERAISGGPLDGDRVVLFVAISSIVAAVVIALSLLAGPLSDSIVIEPDPTRIPLPAPSVSPTGEPSAAPQAGPLVPAGTSAPYDLF